jgi:hypothetical protein
MLAGGLECRVPILFVDAFLDAFLDALLDADFSLRFSLHCGFLIALRLFSLRCCVVTKQTERIAESERAPPRPIVRASKKLIDAFIFEFCSK